jgi:hypothetical protein
MERLDFQRSRAKHAGLVLLALGFVVVGWFLATSATGLGDRVMGWLCVVFFGACLLVGAKRFVEGGVAFAFERAGIISPDSDLGVLPWAEIQSCAVVTIKGNRFLAMTFRDPERLLGRVSPAKRKLATFNEKMGWGHWALAFSGITPGLDEALAFIRANQPGLLSPAARLGAPADFGPPLVNMSSRSWRGPKPPSWER